jgi:hypothetical protein
LAQQDARERDDAFTIRAAVLPQGSKTCVESITIRIAVAF